MPSATVGNNAVQCATPDLGNGSHSETMKQVLGVIDKKVRNMEKKKSKLDDYQAKKNKGEKLNQDQLEALSKYQEVLNNLEFARELQKSFISLGQEVQKAVKKTARREQLLREEAEQRRLKAVLELQFVLDQLGDETVRRDLKQPDASGSPLFTEADLALFDGFYKMVGPERSHDIRLSEQYEEASQHWWDLLEGRDKAVAGTTYKFLKESLEKILASGYFDRAQSHHNGTCEEADKPEQMVEVEAKEDSLPEATVTEKYTEPIQVETTEFVNRQFNSEAAYSSTEKVEEWAMEAQMVNSLQCQSPAPAPEPTVTVNPLTPCPPPDPVVRKQAVQDLMAQMQGTYNFMQDSILEFDGQALDPAIVSAQPMKSAQTVDLQQMAHSESRVSQTCAMTGPQEPSQPSIPCSLSSAFPPVSKPTHTGGINVNAAPFQSVQAVFNMSAPVPPARESPVEALKQASQFPGGYTQSFSQQENKVDQSEIPQQTLQAAVGGFQPQDQVLSSVGHEEPSGGAGFGQSAQFYNGRSAPRGGPRNGRGMMNGYRGSANGFRGGYENYRPPFTNAPNSNYGQTQFTASRDLSNSSYQREQGFKRGAAQGPRSLPRGNAQAMRS
ncbi:caprin-1a isoform X1 [Periophthalmus magnuspinnatus]|uniref:caprin-1a isoform X1 n=1 Tax=Periophthalmus magnuspinnatus TaxID=409849 RepID=UPI00145B78F5|nr:caprin-1a isoform X1 [Periophthalmus magnuspinnatus]